MLGLGSKHSLAARLLLATHLAHLPSVPKAQDLTCAASRDAGSAWVAKVELATSYQSQIQTSAGVVAGGVREAEGLCFGASELDVARLELCLACLL